MRHVTVTQALLITVVLTAGLAASARAQEVSVEAPLAPSTPFSYQGRLEDAGGPANGSYDLTFKLFDAALTPPGVQVGATAVLENQTVVDGLFTVQLDFGGSIFTGASLWLEIATRPGASGGSFAVLAPRQRLYPAPAAYYAHAGVATDVACAGCVGTGDLGGGTPAGGQVLTATGVSSMDWQSPPWPIGSGGSGQVAFWSGAAALAGSASLTWDGVLGSLSAPTLVLPATSGNTGSVMLGGSRFLHSAGDYSTFLGAFAGSDAITGSFNTGVGYDALYSATTGGNNTAVGANCMASNTKGASNVAVGYGALQNSTVAGGNTAVGRSALSSQSHDNGGAPWNTYNTAVGLQALQQNQPSSTTDGYLNTAVGALALESNTTGSRNTAVGYAALGDNHTADHNTALGYQALWRNQVGAYNTAAGDSSLMVNTKGHSNTAYGAGSMTSNTTAGRNTAVGYYALAAQNFSNGDATWNADNTAIGYQALNANQPTSTTTGRQNTAVGALTGNSHTYSACTFVGHSADASVTDISNAMALGNGASVDASNKVVIGNTSVTSIGGHAGWSNYSDVRGKRDIRDLELGLDLILALRPVEYRLANGNGKLDFGFVAQEVEALLGEGTNVVDVGADPERTLALRYSELIAPLVRAVQQQQAMILEKDRRLERQDALIEALAARVAALERHAAGQGPDARGGGH